MYQMGKPFLSLALGTAGYKYGSNLEVDHHAMASVWGIEYREGCQIIWRGEDGKG